MKTSFARNLTTTLVLLMVAMFAMGVAFEVLAREFFQKRTMENLDADAEVISALASAYESEGKMTAPSFFVNLTVANRVSSADAVICDREGKVLLCSDSPMGCGHQGCSVSREYVEEVLRTGRVEDTGVFRGLYEDTRYVLAVPIRDYETQAAIGLVIVSTPVQAIRDMMRSFGDIYLYVTLIVVILCIIFTTFFASRNSSPLRQMAKVANAFGHGDLNARVNVSQDAPAEVTELALAFNNMASSLQKSEYQRQQFVANVSHELKTPKTTIGGYVDGILDGTIPPEKQRHYMQIVSDETKRLSRLVRSMLDISQLQDQGGIPEEKKSVFDVEECAGQVLITFEQKINDKALNVHVEMPEHPVYIRACRDYITQVIYNLLDNAVKFSPREGALTLRIQEGGGKAYVSVRNQGDTIPPEELPLVFDRFHKLDKSRSQNRDGWGLGLYIVKTIVCSHGEDISVTSRDGVTEFTFTMPLENR